MAAFESAPHRLADRLTALRDKYFVGRSAELELFNAALDESSAPALFFVHGPGGVGKSVLVRQFARAAANHGATVVRLDGRDLEPSPAAFLAALRSALELTERDAVMQSLGETPCPVLLIDTYETLAPLDSWIRDVFLPQLPSHALVVLAGRTPPSQGWRADPAWSELAQVIPLRNLQPRDSRAYLSARGVPEGLHAGVLEFTHGHPLALSLLADLLIHGAERPFRPEESPDTVRALLERFVDRVPSAVHWRALAVCAHARVTTEALLSDVVGADDGAALFDWLRNLPFVEQSPLGLFPHDLAREVLEADLRWRDPDTYAALHARVRDSLVARLQSSRGLEQQGAYFDFLYLARHGVISRAYYDWASFGHLYAEMAVPGDHSTIVSLVRCHEGEASARIAEYWLERQPAAFVVFREAGQRIAGFSGTLLLESVSDEDVRIDPAVAAAWRFAQSRSPLRSGERFMHHRFYIGRDAHQDLTIHNMVAMVATLRWLTTPRLAWSFAAVAEPEQWAPMFEAIRFPRSPDADFEVGGRRYGLFTHDWRLDPVQTWIEVKTALDPRSLPASVAVAPQLLVLSEPDFEAAVRQALRDLHRPEALAKNPLARSRLVREHGSLRDVIFTAAAELRGSPRSEKLYRALSCTYLAPAATQELAAEHLGLPFNTYRYQLAAAIKRLTEILWQRELS